MHKIHNREGHMSFINKDNKQETAQKKPGLLGRMAQGLLRTKSALGQKIGAMLAYYDKIDDDFIEELEEILISSDMGAAAAAEITAKVRQRCKAEKISDTARIYGLLRDSISEIMRADKNTDSYPLLILVVGVNGVGKTTAIGKLAYRYSQMGKSVLLAAGDTFRAAAAEQLEIWAQRSGAQVVRHGEGADSAAVIFDALSAAAARGVDVCICDTAGRLQNKRNLMDELAKVGRIIAKGWQGAKETYIVLDATTGQNALSQVKLFDEAVKLDGIILTKLDGTAKGGVAVAVKQEFGLNVRYVGIGEGKEDLIDFDPDAYAANII